jgi:hypothetical protein
LPPRNDRIYERQPYNSRARPFQSTSTLKLSTPTNESTNSPSFLRRTHTSHVSVFWLFTEVFEF